MGRETPGRVPGGVRVKKKISLNGKAIMQHRRTRCGQREKRAFVVEGYRGEVVQTTEGMGVKGKKRRARPVKGKEDGRRVYGEKKRQASQRKQRRDCPSVGLPSVV